MGTDTILGLRLGAEAPGQTGPFSSGPGEQWGSLSRAGARDQRPGSCWPGELQGPGPDRARLRARPISRAPPGLRPPPAPSALLARPRPAPQRHCSAEPAKLNKPRGADSGCPPRGLRPSSLSPPCWEDRQRGKAEARGPGTPGRPRGGVPCCWGCTGVTRPRRAGRGAHGGQGEAPSPTGGLGSPAARRPSSVRGRWLSPGPTQCGEQAACGVPAPSLPGGPGHWGWDKEQAAETPELGPARAGGERGPGEGRGPRAPSAGRGENRLTTSADL